MKHSEHKGADLQAIRFFFLFFKNYDIMIFLQVMKLDFCPEKNQVIVNGNLGNRESKRTFVPCKAFFYFLVSTIFLVSMLPANDGIKIDHNAKPRIP